MAFLHKMVPARMTKLDKFAQSPRLNLPASQVVHIVFLS